MSSNLTIREKREAMRVATLGYWIEKMAGTSGKPTALEKRECWHYGLSVESWRLMNEFWVIRGLLEVICPELTLYRHLSNKDFFPDAEAEISAMREHNRPIAEIFKRLNKTAAWEHKVRLLESGIRRKPVYRKETTQ